MKPNAPIMLYFIAYLALFGTWAAIIFTEHARDNGAEALLQYIQLTLASLTGHVLTMIQPAAPDRPAAPVNTQAGHSDPSLLLILAGMMALALTGCAGFQQAVTGYESAAIKGVRAAEDNNIAMWTANACGTPFSAAIRNPQVVPALKVLCLPSGAASDPSTLLDVVPVAK